MSANLERLSAVRSDGSINVVVETPRGARVKLAFSAELGTFEATRALSLGVTYPYDWGFVPGTRAEDGDPLDALVLHDEPTYPGVVLACDALGVIVLSERSEERERREHNNRLIVAPRWQSEHRESDTIPPRTRAELEQFFLSATFFTGKEAKIEGWMNAAEARALVESSVVK